MNNIILFGTKEEFGIQLGLHTNKEKCKLCFWAKGRKIGSFTRGGGLEDSINTFNKFSVNRENYYLPILEGMTPIQIMKFLFEEPLLSISSASGEKFRELEKRVELYLSFGSQFTNDTSISFFLYKDEKVIIIYQAAGKTNIDEFVISFSSFNQVFQEYITYCRINRLV